MTLGNWDKIRLQEHLKCKFNTLEERSLYAEHCSRQDNWANLLMKHMMRNCASIDYLNEATKSQSQSFSNYSCTNHRARRLPLIGSGMLWELSMWKSSAEKFKVFILPCSRLSPSLLLFRTHAPWLPRACSRCLTGMDGVRKSRLSPVCNNDPGL